MTQVENVPDSAVEPGPPPSPSSAPAEQPTATNEKAEPKNIPERFRGYEELYEVKVDPGFVEPV
ncbi:unnamed protein product, partial [Ranitomeya imitator]